MSDLTTVATLKYRNCLVEDKQNRYSQPIKQTLLDYKNPR